MLIVLKMAVSYTVQCFTCLIVLVWLVVFSGVRENLEPVPPYLPEVK